MPDLKLYHFPGACSQVSLCALEQTGLPYHLEVVNLVEGEQNADQFSLVSPLSKVPVLVIDGAPLTENAAILVYLASLKPEALLFPLEDSARAKAEIQAGLSFCGATLHPNVRGVLNPARVTAGDVDGVRARSKELLAKGFGYAEKRLAGQGWWLYAQSIIDVYLNWAFMTAVRGGFDPGPFPTLLGLETRLMSTPAFARTMQLESDARRSLGL
jgi:glutathione S-transferase